MLDRISQGTFSPEQELLRSERLAEAMKVPVDLSTGFGRKKARAQIALRDNAWEEDGVMMVVVRWYRLSRQLFDLNLV